MTKKKEKTTLEVLIEKSYCAFCHKKGNKCVCKEHNYWEREELTLKVIGYDLEDLQYKVRKATDALYEVQTEVDKKIEENLNCQKGWKKQKPKPVKKAG